ncbi:MAG: hypothetical protein REJ23_00810 [Brevundimonas sp.]|nr:hypothetical protein [Brevundimonas sp.]
MRAVFLAVLAACLFAGSALAQAPMTLETFVTRANRIPLNPTAMLRPDAHRLKGEVDRAFATVRTEVQTARAEGRRAPACPPARIELDVRQMLAHLNAIPQARRQRMTVTDGIRDWMGARYPCPA